MIGPELTKSVCLLIIYLLQLLYFYHAATQCTENNECVLILTSTGASACTFKNLCTWKIYVAASIKSLEGTCIPKMLCSIKTVSYEAFAHMKKYGTSYSFLTVDNRAIEDLISVRNLASRCEIVNGVPVLFKWKI